MSDIEQLNAQRKLCVAQVERRDLALKLEQNSAFKKLIIDGFLNDEVVRNCNISADPALDHAQRADALAMAQAGGHLKRFLSAQVQMGYLAERQILEIDEDLRELEMEGTRD